MRVRQFMNTAIRDELYIHIQSMVANQTNLTSGIIEFYAKNNGKQHIEEVLALSKNASWKKKLEGLFPGEFDVKKNKITLKNKTGNLMEQNSNQVGKKMKATKNATPQANLEKHIATWQKTVRQFKGKSLNRKVPKKIRLEGLGMPCPTCKIQMTQKGPQMVTNEHIVPLSIGGNNTCSDSFSQVVAMCKACNSARNQLVTGLKTSVKDDLVRFLILQVHGENHSLDESMMGTFSTSYRSLTGRKIEVESTPKERLTLIIAGFCGNDPSPVLRRVYENLKMIPTRIMILIEQKDAPFFNFSQWDHHVAEVQLIPSGNDNLQVSALALLLKENIGSSACLITQEKSSPSFEKILLSREISCLKTGDGKNLPSSTIWRTISALLPWNWFVRKSEKLNYNLKQIPEVKRTTLHPPQPLIEKASSAKIEKKKDKKSVKKKVPNKSASSIPQLQTHPLDLFRNGILERRKAKTYRDGFPISSIIYILKQIKDEMGLTWKNFFTHFNLTEGDLEVKAVAIMEMSCLEYSKSNKDDDILFVLDEIQPKLTNIKKLQLNTDVKKSQISQFTELQKDVIERTKIEITEKIHAFEDSGKEFRASYLSRVYNQYGGSAEFKKLLGLPINTKFLKMFDLLFGEQFTISGTSPNWNIKITTPYEVPDEQE